MVGRVDIPRSFFRARGRRFLSKNNGGGGGGGRNTGAQAAASSAWLAAREGAVTEHLQHPRLPHAAGQGLGAASPAAGTAPHRVAPHRGGGPERLCRCPGGPQGVKPGPAAGTCPASPATRRRAAGAGGCGRLQPALTGSSTAQVTGAARPWRQAAVGGRRRKVADAGASWAEGGAGPSPGPGSGPRCGCGSGSRRRGGGRCGGRSLLLSPMAVAAPLSSAPD